MAPTARSELWTTISIEISVPMSKLFRMLSLGVMIRRILPWSRVFEMARTARVRQHTVSYPTHVAQFPSVKNLGSLFLRVSIDNIHRDRQALWEPLHKNWSRRPLQTWSGTQHSTPKASCGQRSRCQGGRLDWRSQNWRDWKGSDRLLYSVMPTARFLFVYFL